MLTKLSKHERLWLKAIETRIAAEQPINVNELLVELRDKLPRGFKPSDLSSRYNRGYRPSILGLQATGDSLMLLKDVSKAVEVIRDRMIQQPQLQEVSAASIAEDLGISPHRAEVVLDLVSSIPGATTGSSPSQVGASKLSFGGPDALSFYLGFSGLGPLTSRLEQAAEQSAPLRRQRPDRVLPTTVHGPRGSVFIIMKMDPKDSSLVDVWNTIKEVSARFDLHAYRIDEVQHQDRITDKILEAISTAEFIVADLSGERPNVYYEVGYAHALGKLPILVKKEGTAVHFDLYVHNVPEYSNITSLKAILERRFEGLLGRAPRPARIGAGRKRR